MCYYDLQSFFFFKDGVAQDILELPNLFLPLPPQVLDVR